MIGALPSLVRFSEAAARLAVLLIRNVVFSWFVLPLKTLVKFRVDVKPLEDESAERCWLAACTGSVMPAAA